MEWSKDEHVPTSSIAVGRQRKYEAGESGPQGSREYNKAHGTLLCPLVVPTYMSQMYESNPRMGAFGLKLVDGSARGKGVT